MKMWKHNSCCGGKGRVAAVARSSFKKLINADRYPPGKADMREFVIKLFIGGESSIPVEG